MISYLPRCWESCSEVYWHPRSEWKIVSPVVYGHLRAAISIASHNGVGAARGRPNRVPDCFLRAATGNGRQVHEPLPGADIRDITHPLHSRLADGEVPPDQVGARAQVRGRDVGGHAVRGYRTIHPTRELTLDEFRRNFESLDWQKDVKIKKRS